MNRAVLALVLIALGAAAPAPAQRADPKADGARFDAAVLAGHVKVDGLNGRVPVLKATTVRCTTHLVSGKDDWTIDWTTASVDGASTPTILIVDMGPDQQFYMRFGDGIQLRAARTAGQHLGTGCAG